MALRLMHRSNNLSVHKAQYFFIRNIWRTFHGLQIRTYVKPRLTLDFI